MPLLAAVLLVSASCTNDGLDDGSGPDVILEIMSFDNPPVTAQLSQSTQGTCSVSGTACESNADCADTEVCVRTQACELRVEDWTANIMAAPKNPSAIPPFNDIVMTHVDISYDWENPAITMNPNTFGLGDVAIPAQGMGMVTFMPVSLTALGQFDAEGETAHLTLVFNARTVEGTPITKQTTRALNIETCR
jgi:hypothetical protein